MRLLCLALILLSAQLATAQTILIHLVDGQSGTPVEHAKVNLYILQNYKLDRLPASSVGDHYEFSVTPAMLNIGFASATFKPNTFNHFKSCGSTQSPAAFLVETVFRSGAVSGNTCNAKLPLATPQPGQVVIYVRHLTPSEKFKMWWDATLAG